jgi:two-component system response regulator MtrA
VTQRILLVEDDEQLGTQIVSHLKAAGFDPIWWTRGMPITPDLAGTLQLVVLDLMLPGTYGLDILKSLRTHADVPVLVLSARNESADKVRALKLGADDYMTKPFWPEELVERVRARLRRPTLQRRDVLQVGGIHIDVSRREVMVSDEAITLTRIEFNILEELARRAGEPVTRQWLVENVLDPEREGTERTLDVHVSRLRKKLGAANPIETVWGIGYRLKDGSAS